MKLAAGDAVAAGGIILGGFTLLTNTGPGMAAIRRATPEDADFVAELRRAEITTAVVVLVGTGVMSGLMKEAWPLAIGLLAVMLTVAISEHAFHDDTLVDAPVPAGE